MNERIKELAKAYLVHERYTRYGEIVEEDLYEFSPDELEKFAELIVRECLASIPSDGHRGDFGRAVEFCQQQIKQHFEVEE